MMQVRVFKLALSIERDLSPRDAEKVRGYLGNLFPDNPALHHHLPDGSLLYRYPLIQYKVLEGDCLLLGLGAAGDAVREVFHGLQGLEIGGAGQKVLSRSLEVYDAPFGIAAHPVSYTFITPWLALNQNNYERYHRLGGIERRRELLVRILAGNILSLAKSVGYTVPARLCAELGRMREVSVGLKGVRMLGFLGDFRVNFEIPDYLGLGKSVSRGFGTIRRCNW